MKIAKQQKNLWQKILTLWPAKAKTYETREIVTLPTSEKKPMVDSLVCPYCGSAKLYRRGWRTKKFEKVQLYQCRQCAKSFTPRITKNKQYPLNVILDSLSLYNLGYPLHIVCQMINHRFDGFQLQPATLSGWLKEFADFCRYSRYRSFAIRHFEPRETVINATLAHQQFFRYRFHQAKCELVMQEDIRHHKFEALKEFLAMVPSECPHQYFSKGLRASEVPMTFSKTAMIVRAKTNYANQLAKFVLQSVKKRPGRHEALQRFMLHNDSVTVATEVPVYLTRDDLLHMQTQLGFEMYGVSAPPAEESKGLRLPKLITGHVDLLQVRNGQIHLLDYKPNAEKIQPIEQLTLYAMALSRLTGLRLFEFKCAWFDEKNYFEFFPLHVLHKPRRAQRRRRVQTSEGTYAVNKIKEKIERIRPI